MGFEHGVTFTPDERRLLVAPAFEKVRLVDVEAGLVLYVWRDTDVGLYGARFSPDGRYLVGTGSMRSSDEAEYTQSVWTRRRPEYWWGIAWLPEFWVALFSGVGLVAMGIRRLRSSRSS